MRKTRNNMQDRLLLLSKCAKYRKGVLRIYVSVRLVPVVEIVETSDREQEKTLFGHNIDFGLGKK